MIYNNFHKHDHVSNLFSPDTNTKAEEYIKKTIEYGFKNYFTTNHGSFGDIFEAKMLCNQYGLRCLAGIEGYIVPNPLEKDKSNYHFIAIPLTNRARRQLNVASSRANMEGYYYKPRFFIEDLLKIDPHECILTTACVAGLLRDKTSYEQIFLPLAEHYKESIMLEVQTHLDPLQTSVNQRAIKLSNKFGFKLIAANDSHYIDEAGQKERLELLKGKHITYDEEDGFILDFPSAETMKERFLKQGILSEKQIDEAISNTLIFDQCEEIDLDDSIKMPSIYPNLTPKERVEELKKHINEKFKIIAKEEGILPGTEEFKKYKDGINYEMKIIEDTNEAVNMADYFLFNERNVDLAVNKYGGVLTRGGRGSCASFYINRILGMTQLDRFKINLPIFPDRFVSVARCIENRSMADIDYNCEKQEPFVAASRELLGEHGCYPMYAPGTMQLSEAFRNVCRSRDMDFDTFNDVGKDIEKYVDDEYWGPIIAEANKYVGTIVSGSVHPCAHILSDKDLLEEYGVIKLGDFYCVLITSMEADYWKVLKNDYLIVKVWKLINETFEMIKQPIIPAYQLLNLIKDDERIWNLFRDGITCTLNQVDSDNGMKQAQRYGIHSFEQGAYITAAIRPSFDSWREQFLNHEEYSTGSKDLDKVLENTEHYILYQENLMQYFEWLGVTPAESIGLIKKISKKKIHPEDFQKLETRIKLKWVENTGSEEMFQETWEMIQSCMAYGFCVSGKTKLLRNGNGGGYVPTVEEMYNIYNNRKYAQKTNHLSLYKKYRSCGYGKTLSLFNDGYIYENVVQDIHYTGRQKTYTITTQSGKTITCTREHKFPTPNGEKQLSELIVGDLLYIVGNYQNRNKKYRLTENNESNAPLKGQMGFQLKPNGQSVLYETIRKYNIEHKCRCKSCGCEYNQNFELHHIDEDRTNNQSNNLKWLCNSCHKKIHYMSNRNKRYERGLTHETDTIVSIVENEVEDVYTVTMNEPAHNYAVDTGIITCNCSAHAAATSLDMCYGAYLKVNYPLEYYTVCFNNYEGDEIRTTKLTKELEYFNIKLSDIQFRHSTARYMCDSEHKIIYKGLSSIKYMSDATADDLYALKDNIYDNFIELLVDLKNTTCDSRQLDILIKLDFFSEFGNPNQLLAQVKMFNDIYGKKQFKKDKLEELGVPKYLIKQCAEKETDKMYTSVDTKKLLGAMVKKTEDIKTSVIEKLQYQAEYLGYLNLTIPNANPDYHYVQEYEKGWVTLYRLTNGETLKIKCRNNDWKKNQFNPTQIIKVVKIKDDKRWGKDADGKWIRLDETEPILSQWVVLKNN